MHNPKYENAVRKEYNVKSRLNKLELQTMTVKFNCWSGSETVRILCVGFSHHDLTHIVLKFQIVYLHVLQNMFLNQMLREPMMRVFYTNPLSSFYVNYKKKRNKFWK